MAALTSASQDVSFDRATGLVLIGSGNAAGAVTPLHLRGEDQPRANSMLTYQRLLGVRDRTLAGTGARVPAWMRPGTRLEFQGTYTAGYPVPATTTLLVEEVGADWARLHAVTEVGIEGFATVERSIVSGGTGPFWYAPAALATMRPGDILDDDPHTGVVMRVADVGPTNNGTYVAVAMVANGLGLTIWYDSSNGLPLAYQLADVNGTTSMQLASMG